MNIINIEHISKLFGDKLIFDDASFGLQEGDKVGIVGINGTGKLHAAAHGSRRGDPGFRPDYPPEQPQNGLSSADTGISKGCHRAVLRPFR